MLTHVAPEHGVDKSVEERPVGNGIGTVGHAFRLTVRGGDGAGVEVGRGPDDDRGFEFP